MRRSAFLAFALMSWGSLACSESPTEVIDASSSEPKQVAADARPVVPEPPPPKPPEWLLLPWDSKLHTAPEQYAPALSLLPLPGVDPSEHDRGRVIKVVGEADPEGRWWQLETIDQLDPSVEGLPIEGLGPYSLSLYVPAGTGIPVAKGGPPANPNAGSVLQSGESRPPGLQKEWQVTAGGPAYWPNGAVAGTVRQAHVFIEPGELLEIEACELHCFPIRVGPRLQRPTKLCFERAAVREITLPNPVDMLAGESDSQPLEGLLRRDVDSDVWDELIGDEAQNLEAFRDARPERTD